jgi:hypothetical protein
MLSSENKEEQRKPGTPFWKLKHRVLLEMVGLRGTYDMKQVLEKTERLVQNYKVKK